MPACPTGSRQQATVQRPAAHLSSASSSRSCCRIGKPCRRRSRTTVPGAGRIPSRVGAQAAAVAAATVALGSSYSALLFMTCNLPGRPPSSACPARGERQESALWRAREGAYVQQAACRVLNWVLSTGWSRAWPKYPRGSSGQLHAVHADTVGRPRPSGGPVSSSPTSLVAPSPVPLGQSYSVCCTAPPAAQHHG